MKINKTWLSVHFVEGKSTIELTLNYQTKTYSMTHGTNDCNVTFNGGINDIHVHSDRIKCVNAALLFIKKELL